MSSIHNELRRSVLGRALKNALGVTDGESQLERFSETLQPVMDLWSRPEWSFLRSELLGYDHLEQAAVAANQSGCAVHNPVGSNNLIIVDQIRVATPAAAGTAELRRQTSAQVNVDLPTLGSATHRDWRFPVIGVGQRTQQGSALAPSGTLVDVTAWVANTYAEFGAVPVVVPPGFALSVFHLTINTILRVSFRWRERAAVPGELL